MAGVQLVCTPIRFPGFKKERNVNPSHNPSVAAPARISRWQGGQYHPRETERMMALDGTELASFRRRAAAMAIDMAAMIVIFVLLALPVAIWADRHQHGMKIEFNPFHNWYSTILPVVYFGLSVWLTNGRTLGKWLTGIRVISITHERIGL